MSYLRLSSSVLYSLSNKSKNDTSIQNIMAQRNGQSHLVSGCLSQKISIVKYSTGAGKYARRHKSEWLCKTLCILCLCQNTMANVIYCKNFTRKEQKRRMKHKVYSLQQSHLVLNYLACEGHTIWCQTKVKDKG